MQSFQPKNVLFMQILRKLGCQRFYFVGSAKGKTGKSDRHRTNEALSERGFKLVLTHYQSWIWLLHFHPESKTNEISKSHIFCLEFYIFDPESKTGEILKSHIFVGEGGRSSPFLIQSLILWNPKVPYLGGGSAFFIRSWKLTKFQSFVCGGGDSLFFLIWSPKTDSISQCHMFRGGGGAHCFSSWVQNWENPKVLNIWVGCFWFRVQNW